MALFKLMQPLTFLQPVLYAIFIWWFLTGLIFAFYNRSRIIKLLGFAGITVGLVAALWGVFITRASDEASYIYISLTCGVVIWGWQTASYYLGFLTGPSNNRYPTDPPRSFIERGKTAIQSSLYHELVVIGFAALLAGLTWTQPNQWSLWIFLAVWIMHSLAKINIFLGVRNFRVDLMPDHMHYLADVLPSRTSNLLLIPTIVIAVSLSLMLIYQGIIPQSSPGDSIGFLFTGTTIALGALEIILLVLPVPATIWGWRIRELPNQTGKV